MKTASLALLVLSLSFSAVAPANPCAPAVDEIIGLRGVRIELCQINGPNDPDCLAQEAYEYDFVRSVIQQCPATRYECQRAPIAYVAAWSQRRSTCRSAGSSSDPACVSAQGVEDSRFYPFAVCLLNDW
ncbi:hypothetical protein AZ78_4760 [Lysobacter capsici AZ78]|uniref:Secreted protein n=1 Tax=Lysobacter capsici AZ78 TaxID=1444315 RepID=A0A108UDJ0_9GAMM|nr:hypothetical protein [Lysobacter capsici]KWS07199.1 hypothetical protein AZ78_4760 [Lysobacter capsici AZ78]